MSSSSPVRLSQLNALPVSEFVATLSGIYESSPWVAEAVVPQRPFRTVAALQQALARVVAASGATKQMQLIKAHPELALKGPSAGQLTENSKREQSTSGMSNLNDSEQKQFTRFSQKYKEKHGFPFIIAVLTLDREAIMRSIGERVFNTREQEIRRALSEIDKIAELRLQRVVLDDNATSTSPAGPPPALLGATRSSAGTSLIDVQYGKSRVRVLKVLRNDGPVQRIIEVDVQVLLRGSIEHSYTRGDNGCVVPTDTCKNTVLVVAKESLTDSIEEYGQKLTSHFLHKYDHLSSVDVRMTERMWERLIVATETLPGVFDGPIAPHPHSFLQRGPEKPWTHVVGTKQGTWIESGIMDYHVLKSTASGFSGFPRCDLTVLPETDDRILSTKIAATWTFESTPKAGFRKANERILQTMVDRFATRYSVSVQATVYEMTLDTLAVEPSVAAVKVMLPNVHYIGFNMAPFRLENPNAVFIPTDEPHGSIELHVTREGKKATTQVEGVSPFALQNLTFPMSKPCAPLPPRPRL
jgi:urate oxidase